MSTGDILSMAAFPLQLQRWDTDCMACKAKIIYCLAFHRKNWLTSKINV